MGKLDIFIDGEYYNSIQKHFGLNFDFSEFIETIRRVLLDSDKLELDLSHVFFYDCLPRMNTPISLEDQTRYSKKLSFFNYLKALKGVRVREGYLAVKGVSYQQKQVDLLIGLDIAEESSKGLISHLVLVSGDSDLCPAIEVASGRSVQVWLFHGPTYSELLWNAADGRHEIDIEFAKKVSRNEMGSRG